MCECSGGCNPSLCVFEWDRRQRIRYTEIKEKHIKTNVLGGSGERFSSCLQWALWWGLHCVYIWKPNWVGQMAGGSAPPPRIDLQKIITGQN